MLTLRCTKRVAERFRLQLQDDAPFSTGILGDWYATPLVGSPEEGRMRHRAGLRKRRTGLLARLIAAGLATAASSLLVGLGGCRHTIPSPDGPNACVKGPPIKAVEPKYPIEARQKQIEGFVIVEGEIGADGSVQSATVLESSPPGVFDASLLEAYRKWKYAPPAQAGCKTKVRMDFKLDR